MVMLEAAVSKRDRLYTGWELDGIELRQNQCNEHAADRLAQCNDSCHQFPTSRATDIPLSGMDLPTCKLMRSDLQPEERGAA